MSNGTRGGGGWWASNSVMFSFHGWYLNWLGTIRIQSGNPIAEVSAKVSQGKARKENKLPFSKAIICPTEGTQQVFWVIPSCKTRRKEGREETSVQNNKQVESRVCSLK